MKSDEEICEKHIEYVYKYLRCITRNEEIAKDITQETFYSAIKYLDTYKGDCKLETWLCKIAKNEWYKFCNKNSKWEFVDTENIDLVVTDSNDLEFEVVNKESVKEIYRIIYSFEEETRQIMLLRLEMGMSFKEIGNVFAKTENWARVKFYRGKQKIVEVLRNERD